MCWRDFNKCNAFFLLLFFFFYNESRRELIQVRVEAVNCDDNRTCLGVDPAVFLYERNLLSSNYGVVGEADDEAVPAKGRIARASHKRSICLFVRPDVARAVRLLGMDALRVRRVTLFRWHYLIVSIEFCPHQFGNVRRD